jgi:hypothetical protein
MVIDKAQYQNVVLVDTTVKQGGNGLTAKHIRVIDGLMNLYNPFIIVIKVMNFLANY